MNELGKISGDGRIEVIIRVAIAGDFATHCGTGGWIAPAIHELFE
jgi:hypothetical protein